MARIVLDHIAIAATTLDEGRGLVEDALGVPLLPGGRHAHFGTHNMLLGLEDGLYLEVIATDPDAPAPEYPRWFDLDRFEGPPRLSNWICRTDDLDAALAPWPDAGAPVALSRGDLRWRMAVPETGILPFDNCFPALMEWQTATHPAETLPASGCRLETLHVRHPQAGALNARLESKLEDRWVRFETGPPSLRAEIATPGGLRVLS